MTKLVASSSVLAGLMLTLVSQVTPGNAASQPAGAHDATAATGKHSAPQSVITRPTLTLAGAEQVIQAAVAKARERSAGGAIAVVDDGGNIVAVLRLDGTFPSAASVSIGKARTAAIFRKPTKAFEDSINSGRVALAAVSEMTPLQGGIPIVVDGVVVGGVGVSGAHSQVEDEEIAIAGAQALASSVSTGDK